MLLSLWHSKTISFFLSIISSVAEVFPSKRFSSVWIAVSLFSVFIHQNIKSTTVLCIYNILEKSFKAPSKISLIDVDSAYHQEANTIKFIHLLINCGEVGVFFRMSQNVKLKIVNFTFFDIISTILLFTDIKTMPKLVLE